MAFQRLARAEVGNARLHADAIADLEMADLGTDGRHDARGFMTEHHRLVDDEVADAAVLQIVDIAAADAHRLDSHPDLVGSRLKRPRKLDVAETNLANALENDGFHLHSFSSRAADLHSRTGLRGSS